LLQRESGDIWDEEIYKEREGDIAGENPEVELVAHAGDT
jgi:hypothetical protein